MSTGVYSPGRSAQGRKAISALYKTIPGGANTHILISNQKIVVHGNAAATVNFIWTEINSRSHSATPRLVEQGREHDELLKRNGRWYFVKRVVTSDGGLPAALEKTYKER